MNDKPAPESPEVVTSKGIGSTALLGSFALHPLHLGYAYARNEDDEWWHGTWATEEECVAHLLSEDWEGRGYIAPVRAVTDADDDADETWEFIVYGPRRSILPNELLSEPTKNAKQSAGSSENCNKQSASLQELVSLIFSMKNIPTNEQDNVLSIYWQMLGQIEYRTNPKEDILDKLLVEGAYNVLNRIGYTHHRPRWEDTPKKSALVNDKFRNAGLAAPHDM